MVFTSFHVHSTVQSPIQHPGAGDYYQYLPQVRAIGRWGMYKRIGLFSLPSLVLLLFAHFGAWN